MKKTVVAALLAVAAVGTHAQSASVSSAENRAIDEARVLHGERPFAYSQSGAGLELLTHATCMLPSEDPHEARWSLGVLVFQNGAHMLACWAKLSDPGFFLTK